MKDIQLRQQHASGSDEAFALIVRRHLGWIHGMARRRLRDPHLAEDVVQAVFLLLHQKAPAFPGEGALVRWLQKTTWYATEVTVRTERRRKRHEFSVAATQAETTEQPESPEWKELAPILDRLVCKLNRADREAVLLRFFTGMTFEEVGAEIGTTAEAARKRVDRAIDKLRRLAADEGLTLSAAAMVGHFATHLQVASTGLIARSVVTATSTSGSALSTSSAAIAKGVTIMTTMKSAAATAAAFAAIVCVTGTIWAVLPAESTNTNASAGTLTVVAATTVPAQAGNLAGANFTLGTGQINVNGGAVTLVAADPRVAPFAAVRWAGDVPQIYVDRIWYELQAVDHLPASQIVDFLKKDGTGLWRKHFAEDLIDTMKVMNHEAAATVTLSVKKLDTGETIDLPNVAVTADNRRRIFGVPEDPLNGTARLFSGVRWNADVPQVQVNGIDTWYDLVSIDQRPAGQILEYARKSYGDLWKQHFESHSAQVAQAERGMTRDLGASGFSELELETLDSQQAVTVTKNVFGRAELATGTLVVKRGTSVQFPRVSPFSSVRWNADNYEVKVRGTWYTLASIDGLSIEKIIGFSKSKFADIWQKRIDEDLVDVLAGMGHLPKQAVRLELRSLEKGEPVTLDNVQMTPANRRAIFLERNPGQIQLQNPPQNATQDGTQGL